MMLPENNIRHNRNTFTPSGYYGDIYFPRGFPGDFERANSGADFCASRLLRQVVSSASGISFLVAALDLKLVRSIRDAIRTADIHSGRTGPNGTFPPGHFGPRKQIEPEPHFNPRVVYHPTPRFEPRPVVHCRPIVVEPCEKQTLAPVEPEPQPCRTKCPLPAPWQESVWKTPIPVPSEIKVHLHRTDVVHKGSLIDLFI